ncbi:hypothetical protein [Streptomyces sp. NBC_00887]|uniref:hypothetical protein n=1 Tax=Streptomyces sp. NBC_00887 TaxID=2975859 RepID=UPI003867D5D5|nr:hypothetical protein OG844_27910 [Streptomyces sp. NBC_00887]
MLDAAAESGNQALAAACAIYLGVVFVTSRGLIAAPRYRDLLGRIRDCRARIEILAAGDGDPTTKTTCTAVARRLDDLEKHGTVVWRLLPRAGVVAIPLSKLASAWRVLHTAERRLLRLENDDETGILMRSLHLELAASKRQDDGELAATLAVAPGSGPEARALLIGSYERLHAREDAATDAEFEQQRIALWLATTGVGMLLALGMTLDHQLTMLLGALGGFLSPVIGVLRPQPERPRSWGVLVLAPVGGALAAVGGLLLVRLLADPDLNLLGQVFLDNSWDAPDQPLALTFALLFGFSGTLFSRLAATATRQFVPPAV